jgi:ribosomal protein S14
MLFGLTPGGRPALAAAASCEAHDANDRGAQRGTRRLLRLTRQRLRYLAPALIGIVASRRAQLLQPRAVGLDEVQVPGRCRCGTGLGAGAIAAAAESVVRLSALHTP